MSPSESPSLSLAIARLNPPEANHFATWVVDSPLPSGYVHHDCILPDSLSQLWRAWLEMFSPENLPPSSGETSAKLTLPPASPDLETKPSYSSRLMQHLGIHLWQWLFQGSIQNSFHRSQGIALGQSNPLRLRLDLRDADLIPLPWEIMQAQPGQPAISLNQRLLFSRTTCDVNPLSDRQIAQSLNILLVLGHNEVPATQLSELEFLPESFPLLQLEGEAERLTRVLAGTRLQESDSQRDDRVPCAVKTLIQPNIAELIAELESRRESDTPYNVLFYAGHGIPAPDGGLLFLQPETTINGTELAHLLVGCGIGLAVFNACWSAQPAVEKSTAQIPFQAVPSSSLAKVLIHHGVPAVLGMRDSITDEEALSFIQAFARALAARMPIDQAVAVARQHLLTLYKFNQPAWTLPVLYMHPEFDGELIRPAGEVRTELPPNSATWLGYSIPRAWLRLHEGADVPPRVWPVEAGMVRVGRGEDNDIVLREQWVSSRHAEIFCRNGDPEAEGEPTYFLRDFSRYGTLVAERRDWQRVHHQEVALRSGTQLKFGSSQGQVLEFVIETPPPTP